MNVLKCEFIKLRKSTAFKITWLVTICFSVLFGFMILYAGTYSSMECKGFLIMINAFSNNWLFIIIGAIIGGLFICNDFENHTFQESITCGNSHLSVIASKTFIYTLSTLAIYVPYPIVSSTIVAVKYGWGFETAGVSGLDFIAKMTLFFTSIFFSCMPIITLFVLICFLVQKAGTSIAINMPVMIVGMVVFPMLQQFVFPESEIYAKIYGYSFLGLSNMIFGYLNKDSLLVDVTMQNYLPIIIAGAIWSILFFALAAVTFKKRDLK